jgi:hypothetical protein
VPSCQPFTRRKSAAARVEQSCRACRLEPGFLRDLRERHEAVQVPGALEVRFAVEPIAACQHAVFVGGQEGLHFVALPGVELAFVTLGVGIERGVEGAARCAQFGERPGCGRLGGAVEEGVAGRDRRLGVEREQRAVVVEHFLEVRDHPVRIHRIPA